MRGNGVYQGWEGPVFVAQLFAISDTAAALVVVKCGAWQAVGVIWLLLGPVAFIVFSGYRVHKLVKVDKTLKFNKGARHRPKEMFDTLKNTPGLLAKASQVFIFYMDIRFVGGWAKTDAMAKFWGWMMAAYTDKFLFVCSWMLAKKTFNAINKNWLDGRYNAAANIIIACVELGMFSFCRPFRDNVVNVSKVLGSLSNLMGVLAAALPFLVLEVPEWLGGAFVMLVTSAGTLVMAAQACMGPIASFLGAAFEVSGKAASACLNGDLVKMCNIGGVLSSVGTALWVRCV
jgi:hypothetical protein